jgi:hypothetical protein
MGDQLIIGVESECRNRNERAGIRLVAMASSALRMSPGGLCGPPSILGIDRINSGYFEGAHSESSDCSTLSAEGISISRGVRVELRGGGPSATPLCISINKWERLPRIVYPRVKFTSPYRASSDNSATRKNPRAFK